MPAAEEGRRVQHRERRRRLLDRTPEMTSITRKDRRPRSGDDQRDTVRWSMTPRENSDILRDTQ